jgi:hypothetical protein
VTAVRPRQDGRVFAAVRALKLRTRAQVNNARDHAIRRDGRKFVLRPRAIAGESLRWCINGGEVNFDLWGCFQDHKKTTGARERQGSAIMLHLLFIISPEWVCRAGGLHDRENPRNIQLFEQAIACARKEIGGVVAARLDLDEMGGAVGAASSRINGTLRAGSAKEQIVQRLETRLDLRGELAATGAAEKKFNIFKIRLGGGW